MKTQQELQEYIKLHPAALDHQVASNMRRHHVHISEVKAARAALSGKVIAPSGKVAALLVPDKAPKVLGSSVRDLLHQFDELAKVKSTMKALSRLSYLEDDEMRVKSGVALRAWPTVRAHKDVACYRYKLPNQHFVWMHPEAQKELSDAINIAQN
jgi:hypothetical protein